MKINTTKVYPYTADSFGYTLVTSADGTTTETVYNTVPDIVTLALKVNLLGELIIESTFKMQLNSYLENVVDKNGDEIYTDGVWQIIQTAPLLTSIGIKEGYKYRAKIIEGNI